MSIYFNNPWKPVEHSIVKDEKIKNEIFEKGLTLIGRISEESIFQLTELFNSTHSIKPKDGGMFYSVYSQDLTYRKEIHYKIGNIMKPYLDKYLVNYRTVINSFVVKYPGPKSNFYIHQDTTGTDETKFSPLNFWIPLQDVTESNGCMGVIPYTHKMFSPYRSISFPAPYDAIHNEVYKYLTPYPMKAGEILAFDNRILHNSFTNQSEKPRVVVVCGILHIDAPLITCFKNQNELGGTVELIQNDDAFLLENLNFLIDCQNRPKTGCSLGFKNDPYTQISKEELHKLFSTYSLKENIGLPDEILCELVQEPI